MNRLFDLARSYRRPNDWLDNIRWRFPSTVSNLNCVFVVGAPRSGTTLLQRVIGSHSAVFSIPCETGLFSYQNIFSRRHFGLPEDKLKQLFSDSTDIVDFFSKCVGLITPDNTSSRFLEKTPQHAIRIHFLQKHFPNSKIVHVLRDGRDCYCSSRSHPNIPQNKSAATYAKYWRQCVRTVRLVGNPQQVHTVRYETFCTDPSTALAQAMEFMGLQIEAQQLDAVTIGSDPRASLPHFKRLNQVISGLTTNRWKKELSEMDLRHFYRIAGDELLKNGYSVQG